MADQTVTIKGEFDSDIAQKAAAAEAAMKSLTDSISAGGTQAAGATTLLGAAIDQGAAKAKTGGAANDYLSKSVSELGENLNTVHEKMNDFSEGITEKMTYPIQQLTYALEAGVVGLVTFGLATYSTLQQANLQLTTFTGSAVAGTTAYKALLALRDPANMASLTGTYETLSTVGGESQKTALRQTSVLANASAPYGDQSAAMMATGAQAFAQINAKQGMDITNATVTPLAKLFPQIYAILGRTEGISASQTATNLARGAAFDDPNLIAQLGATPQATGGRAAESATFKGQIDGMKTAIGDVLASAEAPLAQYLGKDADEISKWADGVEARFGTMGKKLFSELGSGNMSGFQGTLGTILGSPEAAKDITTFIGLAEALGHVLTGVVLPGVEDVADVLTPLLSFMAAHQTTTEVLIASLGGLLVLNKVADFAMGAYESFSLLSKLWSGMGDILDLLTVKMWSYDSALTATTVETDALNTAQTESLGAGTTAGVGGAAAAGAETEAAGGSSMLGPIGALAGVAALGQISNNKRIGQIAAKDHGNITLGNAYDASYAKKGVDFFKSGGEGIAQDATGIFHSLFGGGSKKKTSAAATSGNGDTHIHGNVNVSIPGAGNPEKVANSVPKGLNANINANAARQARRTGKSLAPT